MRVLVVDDNEDIASMISKFLTFASYECTEIHDGKNALKLIETGNYDIVILDISMPGFSGLDVVNALVENNKISEQKIVIFTASSISDHEIQELIDKGVYGCLKKPIDPDALVDYLKTIENAPQKNN